MTYRSEYLLTPPEPRRWDLPAPLSGQAWVYFHLGADNEVLYIGATRQPAGRTQQHEGASEWFSDVADMIWFGPMPELNARAAEREFIAAEQPPNNVRHTEREVSSRQTPQARLSAASKRVERLTKQLARAEAQVARYTAEVAS